MKYFLGLFFFFFELGLESALGTISEDFSFQLIDALETLGKVFTNCVTEYVDILSFLLLHVYRY